MGEGRCLSLPLDLRSGTKINSSVGIAVLGTNFNMIETGDDHQWVKVYPFPAATNPPAYTQAQYFGEWLKSKALVSIYIAMKRRIIAHAEEVQQSPQCVISSPPLPSRKASSRHPNCRSGHVQDTL